MAILSIPSLFLTEAFSEHNWETPHSRWVNQLIDF